MVFLSFINFSRPRSPDKFWRVQQYLRFSWHMRGRKRNCYRIGMRYVHKALKYSTMSRRVKKVEMRHLWNTRLDGAAGEHGLNREGLMEGLARSNVMLDRNMLQNLSIYEPRTFQSLTELAKQTLEEHKATETASEPFDYYSYRG